ncbi:MAG: hypothetical protein EOO28_31550 [Comamonadaceae bacterium]|nr:MAG: hypothetical protein EOO28_31550 [Comamonadaceae bacterium]
MNKTFHFLACGLLAALAALPALAQNSAFATSLKPGDRVTVDIAGYKYQAVFKKYSECRNGDGKCGTITDGDGNTKDVLIRYFNPPAAGAAKAAAANKGTLPTGKFNCFFFSGYLQSIPGFTLAPGGKFTDHVGTGKYTWDAATGIISFTGGAWNGQKVRTDSQGGLGVLKKDGSLGAVSCSKA